MLDQTDLTVACIQMNSGSDTSKNLTTAAKLIHEAAKGGANLVITPENTDFIRRDSALMHATALPEDNNPSVQFFSILARELGIWILVGSMKIRVSDEKVANRGFLFNPKGQFMASYDKIHLFDVELPNGEDYKESENVEGGKKAAIVNVEGCHVGFSICYDLRFPYLYRDLAQKGAQLIAVPSAFTEITGKDHWETLLRARAIETGSYIFAPAQYGTHEGGRKTYGHSMIISPWGKILHELSGDTAGVIMHKFDPLEVMRAREAIPSLQHDCEYQLQKPKGI